MLWYIYVYMLFPDSSELNIRLYIGYEYECPRGHRFFLSGPDKIFKAPGNGSFKVLVFLFWRKIIYKLIFTHAYNYNTNDKPPGATT